MKQVGRNRIIMHRTKGVGGVMFQAVNGAKAIGQGMACSCGIIDGGGGGGADPDAFIFTVTTTGASETVTLLAGDIGTYNATIDWGDDSTSEITAYNDADLAHTYASADTYTVTVTGTFPWFRVANTAPIKTQMASIEQWGDVGFESIKYMLRGCASVVNNATDTLKVTDDDGFDYSFALCNAFNLPTIERAGTGTFNGQYMADGTAVNQTFQSAIMNRCIKWQRPYKNSDIRTITGLTVPAASFGTSTEAFLNNSNLSSVNANAFDVATHVMYTNWFAGCALDQTSVDAVLASMDTAGGINGRVDITGTSSPPSAAGLISKSNLEGKGWTVNVNS